MSCICVECQTNYYDWLMAARKIAGKSISSRFDVSDQKSLQTFFRESRVPFCCRPRILCQFFNHEIALNDNPNNIL
jgi:hypothetical protein